MTTNISLQTKGAQPPVVPLSSDERKLVGSINEQAATRQPTTSTFARRLLTTPLFTV